MPYDVARPSAHSGGLLSAAPWSPSPRLAVWIVPLGDDIADNPRDATWNSMRAELGSVDDQMDTVIADDRTALILGIYQREPVGGDLAWRADIEVVPHSAGAATGTGRRRHVPALDAAALAAPTGRGLGLDPGLQPAGPAPLRPEQRA